MGIYQTVLTIDPSVSQSDIAGLYSCTVENVRGRSSRIVLISGNSELIQCTCTIRYAICTIVLWNSTHPRISTHPWKSAHTTPKIYMHFLLCYVHYMYLPTDINIWLSFHPILERAPNHNVLSNYTQMTAYPGTSFTRLIECTRELWEVQHQALCIAIWSLCYTSPKAIYYMVAFHRLTSKSNMHLLMVTCCCSKCRVLSKLGFKAAGISVVRYVLQGNRVSINVTWGTLHG